MEKQEILNHIEDLSSQQLYEAISEGVVTMDDLVDTEKLGITKRREINAYLKADDEAWKSANNSGTVTAIEDYKTKFPKGKHIKDADGAIANISSIVAAKKDDKAWQKTDKNNRNSLNSYLNEFPNGNHVTEANETLDKIRGERIQTIKNVKNKLPYFLVQDIRDGKLSFEDLEGELNPQFIEFLRENIDKDIWNGVPLELPEGRQDEVDPNHTEVYFWGVPGSGKTCALGSVLSTADHKGYLTKIKDGSGCNYATQLKNIFNPGKVDVLPPPTSDASTQYLPIELTNLENGKIISVSILEVAGEVFKDFYRLRADPQKVSSNHPNLEHLLASNNRKIHFFFVDYSLDDRRDNDNLKQSDYLKAAASYFDESKVFEKNTDAIYLVITKSDMMESNDANSVKEYLNGSKCASLTTALRNQCKKNHINLGNLIGLRFSIGEVCLGGKLCIHNPETSEHILDILFRKVAQNN